MCDEAEAVPTSSAVFPVASASLSESHRGEQGMVQRASDPQPYLKLHRDGSPWARGQMLDGQMHGYWEWFRLDGSRMRSGSFDRGRQIGEWTTYDKTGALVKVTDFGALPGPQS